MTAEVINNEEKYLIWNFERSMWWKPNNHGYTIYVTEAGVYSKDDAELICERGNLVRLNEKMVKWADGKDV